MHTSSQISVLKLKDRARKGGREKKREKNTKRKKKTPKEKTGERKNKPPQCLQVFQRYTINPTRLYLFYKK